MWKYNLSLPLLNVGMHGTEELADKEAQMIWETKRAAGPVAGLRRSTHIDRVVK